MYLTTRTMTLTLAVLLLAGCGRNGGRQPVSGSVTLDGKPLARGSINFQPATGARANSAGAIIEGGKYAVPAATGLLPGKYDVTIRAWNETNKIIIDPQMGAKKEMVPIVFKEDGDLAASVDAGGANQCNFSLTSKP